MFEQQTQLKELGLSLVLRANVIVLPRGGFIRSLARESKVACFPRVLCFRFSQRHNLCSVLAVFARVFLIYLPLLSCTKQAAKPFKLSGTSFHRI